MPYINGKQVLFGAQVNVTNVPIVQTTGDSETAVMSQKAVTDALNELTESLFIEENANWEVI